MYDACVIGAGLSGLVCARNLADAGLRPIVLEARDRVGGRLVTREVAGVPVDAGGQWLTAGQDRLAGLLADLGLETFEHAREGRALVDEHARFVGKLLGAFSQNRAIKTIEQLMRAIPLGDPARAPDAATLDRTSLATYLEAAVRDPVARARILLHADLVFACDPADLSLLSYLSILHATGGFRPDAPDLPGGGREHRIVGGAQGVAERLAAELGDRGELRLGVAVEAIEDVGVRVRVRVRGQEDAVEARRCVLAIPPQQVKKLSVALPPAHRAYVDGARMGPVVKVYAAYARPFWRDDGLSGEAYLPRGTVRATVDMSLPGPNAGGHAGVLCSFVVGPEAARWASRDPEERRADVLGILASKFGERARSPEDYLEQDWATDAWSGGCVASTPMDVLARGARWRESHGNVHIAGTESAVRWPGYMDGAVEAGERAAREVIEAILDAPAR